MNEDNEEREGVKEGEGGRTLGVFSAVTIIILRPHFAPADSACWCNIITHHTLLLLLPKNGGSDGRTDDLIARSSHQENVKGEGREAEEGKRPKLIWKETVFYQYIVVEEEEVEIFAYKIPNKVAPPSSMLHN